jgi:putative tricarboxylic transport membrane protein
MVVGRLKAALPYAVGLALAIYLWVLTGQFQTTLRPGQLGPAFWPRIAICLMSAVCLFEIAKCLLGFGAGEIKGIASTFDEQETLAPDTRNTTALAIGLVLIIAYAALVTTLGYLLCSFLFVIAFMYAGGYRNHRVIWLSGALGLLAIAFVFLRLVYVSLPRGQPPFDVVTQLVSSLIGLK